MAMYDTFCLSCIVLMLAANDINLRILFYGRMPGMIYNGIDL